MQLPSWDVFIGLFFLVGIAYGFILRRDKAITTLLSVYLGIVVASRFSQDIFDFFNGEKVIADQIWIRSNASASTIAVVLFLLTIVLISGAINSSNSRTSDISPIEVISYSALTIALILAYVLDFLPEPARLHYMEVSRIAKYIYTFKTLITIAPPIILIALNYKRK